MLEALRAEGVRYVFGNPRSTEVPMLDALVDFPDLQYVLALHEVVAISMADGFARSSGRPAVASVHGTPGVANALGALYNAKATGSPIVVLVGLPDSRIADRRAAEQRRGAVAALRQQADARRAEIRKAEWDRKPIRATRVYAELREAMGPRDVLVDEAISMAQYLYDFFDLVEPGTLFSSKPGHLGWAMGAALGVQLAQPDRRVVAGVGDGSALFGIQALWTASRYEIPVTYLIFNNGGYVAEKDHLRNFGGRAFETGTYIGADLGDVDFASLAAGFGVEGGRVSEPDQIGPALGRALGSRRPYLLDVLIDPTDAGYRRQPVPV